MAGHAGKGVRLMGSVIAHHGLLLGSGGGVVTPVTWNPSDKATEITLSGGNLIAGRTSATGWKSVRATQGRGTSGKWYCEVLLGGTSGFAIAGLADVTSTVNDIPGAAGSDCGYLNNGDKYEGNIQAPAGWGASFASGDVIGIAYDAGTGKMWFAKNNVWQGSGSPNPATGVSPADAVTAGTTRYPMVGLYQDATSRTWTGKFAASDFTYSPPSGFSSWQ